MTATAVDRARYQTEGWLAPIDVLTPGEAAELLALYEEAEQTNAVAMENRNNLHLVLPFLADIAFNQTIVGVVSELLGQDLSLWGSVMFIKEPSTSSFVSWHQDATYMGLNSSNLVTPWLALTPSTPESGCVAVIPGSHLDGQREHQDQFGENNILTRGQEVADVDETQAVNLVLKPGQMSVHHPWLIHGSRPNTSEHRRVGFALQAYMASDVAPARGSHHALPIAGMKPHEAFRVVNRPSQVMSPADVQVRNEVNEDLANVLYEGSEQRRTL